MVGVEKPVTKVLEGNQDVMRFRGVEGTAWLADRARLRCLLSTNSRQLKIRTQSLIHQAPGVLRVFSHIAYYPNCPRSLEGSLKSFI